MCATKIHFFGVMGRIFMLFSEKRVVFRVGWVKIGWIFWEVGGFLLRFPEKQGICDFGKNEGIIIEDCPKGRFSFGRFSERFFGGLAICVIFIT